MAGDWIKMRGNLWDDPRVARLCDITDKPEATIVGGLYWLWATADQHTEDGGMPGLTIRAIDRKTGIDGFAQALCTIGWLTDLPEGVRIVKFTEHNGSSAKRRCADAQRKAGVRSLSASGADILRTGDGHPADEMRRSAELEKRREETQSGDCVSAAKATRTTRGNRLPADWSLPKSWGVWAQSEYPHWEADTVRLIAATFADHWHAKAGKAGVMLDWEATWRNWCRSDITQRAHPPNKASASKQTALEARNAAVAAKALEKYENL